MQKNDLLDSYRPIAILQTIVAQLTWDLEVNLPSNSHDLRNEQILFLNNEIHRLSTQPDFLEAIQSAKVNENISEHQLRNLQDNIFSKAAISLKLQNRITKLELSAADTWKMAKENNDFKAIVPTLKELILLRNEATEQILVHPIFKNRFQGFSHYDVMINMTDPGLRGTDLERLFIPLKQGILERVRSIPLTEVPRISDLNLKLNMTDLLGRFGFSFEQGRLDYVSNYPFCSGGSGDTRITTQSQGDAIDNLLSTLHEMGHGLYEQNLPKELYLTPSGNAASTGFHESQSRFYENQIGRSDAFIKYLAAISKNSFEDLKPHFRNVSPGIIRTSSDELHYNLHIILRWELEQALVNGSLAVEDLSEAWSEKVKSYFGLEVKNESEGCLQDVHWFISNFGWFPSYTLGNMIAAQLYEKMKIETPNWEERIENGDLSFIKDLMKVLHKQAATHDFNGTVHAIFGASLSHQHLLGYLDERYGS